MTGAKSKKSFVKMKKIKEHLVECRKSQKLDLSGLELTELPEEFMNLVKGAGVTNIVEFNFHNNELTELSNEIAEFRMLRCLRLSRNHFQTLPHVALKFPKLQILDMAENEAKEIDTYIRFMGSLRELNYSRNHIMTLPIFWDQLTLLVHLNLAKNRIMELPDSLGSLKSLQRLDISGNLLSTLPRALQNLQELVSLDAHGNHLTEVPPALGLLRSLTEFDCSGNPLSETITSFYSQGFERFMDYLRNMHELQQLEELILQKPPGETIGSYKRCPTRHDIGQRPLLRSGCSITQAGPITYIFGGRITNYVKVEETFAIDSRTLLWVKLPTSGSIPSPRDGHAAAFDGSRRLYVYGGRNEENKLLNDVYYLDLKTLTWYQPAAEGSVPLPREGAVMDVVGSQLIVFGGRGSRQRYNDVHVLDTQTWMWSLQNTKGSIPAPRQNAAYVCKGTKIYVHGGKGSLVLDDLHVLDTVGFTWSKLSPKGCGPTARCKHSCWIFQNRFYVFGGVGSEGEPLSSLYVLPLGSENKGEVRLSATMVTPNQQEKALLRSNMWSELESEIPPCQTNVYCHCDDKVIILQEGSPYQEAIPNSNDDTSNVDGVSWDYYLEASCDSLPMKTSGIELERTLENKKARVESKHQAEIIQLPKSFQLNSEKELKLVEYVKDYHRRLMQAFPQRRCYMFVAQNECQVEKCVCTTVRPSHCDYVELFRWESCANFLANFITYEPLEDPLAFPKYLPSPYSILTWRRGDCFDFAVVLVSFLSGSGYDAYCVVGYAPLEITACNQEGKVCPFIGERERAEHKEPERHDTHESHSRHQSEKNAKVVTINDYTIQSSPILNGDFLGTEKQGRDTLVANFIHVFNKIYDEGLQLGHNEEEDNLVTFCKDRPSPNTTSQDVLSPQGQGEHATCPPVGAEADSDVNKNSESRESDPLNRRRLHCWVLVTASKRDVIENFFIEPSTGVRYQLQDSPYQAVEYIWNQHNIFINKQLNPDRMGLSGMSWDLRDTKKWDRVLDTHLCAGYMEDSVLASVAKADTARNTPESAKGKNPQESAKGESPANGTNENNAVIPVKLKTKDSMMLAEKITEPEDITMNGFLKPYHWLLPSSWVPQLKIPMEVYVTRCPGGVKRTNYYRCTHELYSFYGDFVRWDGLIERIILYEDDERTIIKETHDYFQRRKDALKKRKFIPGINKVHDFFDNGASFALKETEIVDGQSRKFLFYEGSRNDGLASREEIIGEKITEKYVNNEACLIYRCARYGRPLPPPAEDPNPVHERHVDTSGGGHGDSSVKGSASRPSSVRQDGSSRHGRVSVDSLKGRTRSRMMSRWLGSSSNRHKTITPSEKQHEKKVILPKRRAIAEKLLPIMKITQKYELREGASPKDNVAKYSFMIENEQIRVDYHNAKRHITMSSRLYKKDGSMTTVQEDPFAQKLTAFDKLDEFHGLALAEREAVKAIRDTEREIEEILQQRLKDEQNVVLVTPYIDVACVKQDDVFQDGEDAIKQQTDYLSPFLPPGVRPRQKLTRQQMLDVRDKCLGALKERLVNRATIIQVRYDEETSALAKRRANYERDREQMTVEDEEVYNQECDNAQFRIRILEFRAKQHEEEALKKYFELEKKLQNDPRLLRLYKTSFND